MIYPTYGVIVETPGQRLLLSDLCKKICVHGVVSSRFYINGKNQTIHNDEILPTIPILPVDEFVQTYIEFYNKLITWVHSLRVGDTVVIEEPRMGGDYYPYSFAPEMQKYVGHELTIKSIHEALPYGYLENGTRLKFTLKEAPGYIWHSSMFEFSDNLNVNKLTLTDLIINPFEL